MAPMFNYTCEVCRKQGAEWRRDAPPRFCSRDCRSKGLAGHSLKSVKWIITPEIHEQIRKTYSTMTGNGEVKDLAQKLRLPRWKITRYAIEQGWTARQQKMPDWSEKELAMLEHLSYLSPARIGARLKKAGFNRSETGIVLKRKRMRFLKNLDGYSSRKVAECFGVDSHCVTRWIGLGYLKAVKRQSERTLQQGGDIWYIKDRWVRDFVVDHVHEIDIRKVDKYWFVDLLAGNGQKTEDQAEDEREAA